MFVLREVMFALKPTSRTDFVRQSGTWTCCQWWVCLWWAFHILGHRFGCLSCMSRKLCCRRSCIQLPGVRFLFAGKTNHIRCVSTPCWIRQNMLFLFQKQLYKLFQGSNKVVQSSSGTVISLLCLKHEKGCVSTEEGRTICLVHKTFQSKWRMHMHKTKLFHGDQCLILPPQFSLWKISRWH
jgi:hypothetical protein